MPATDQTLLVVVAAIGAAVVVAPSLIPVIGVSAAVFTALLLILTA